MANDNNEIPPGHSRSGNFEMNFTDVLTRLWSRKFSGVVFVLLSIVVGSFYLRAATYTYTTELVLTPAEQNAAKRSEEHTSELQSLMRISYAVFCLKKKKKKKNDTIE